MRRALTFGLLVACSTPSAPPRPAAPPVAAAPIDASVAPPVDPDARSWVGVRIDNASLRITQVIRGAPGERAGLQIGDQLVSIDGQPVTTVPAFVDRVARTKAGDKLAIVVVRGGGQITLPVTVEARPASPALSTLVGKPAPAFAAQPLAGPFAPKLADLRGKVVVVDFWATWCGPCTFTIPRLNELHAKYESAGLRIVGLSSEEPDVIQKFVASAGIAYAIGHDPDDAIAKDYLREGIPMFVVVDRAGVVRHVIVGADVVALEAAVTALVIAP